jgi:tetratricopeptide (TPR) repeat protein
MILKKNRTKMFLILILLILFSFSEPVMAGLKGPTVDAISYYNQAVDAASNGSVDEALFLINESLTIQPDFPLALITKAGLLIDKGHYSEAEPIVVKLQLTNPDDPYVLSTKASLLVNTGKYDEALKTADMVITKNPEMVEAWILKGTAYGGLHQYQDEISASEHALKLNPNNEKARINLNYGKEMLIQHQNTSHPVDAETKTPLPGYVALEAFLVCVFLGLVMKR